MSTVRVHLPDGVEKAVEAMVMAFEVVQHAVLCVHILDMGGLR